jgi:translation initiation factor 6 (eIF-6)
MMNQIELRKMVVERTAPDKVEDLIIDPTHEIEIKRILGELQQAEAQGVIIPNEIKQRALEQIKSHFDAIKAANPQQAQALGQQLAQMMAPQTQQPQQMQAAQPQITG